MPTAHARVIALIFALLLGGAAEAESVRGVDKLFFDDIDTGRGERRRVELYARALTRYGEPVADISGSDVRITDASERISPDEIRVETLADVGVGMTCVIAIDVSRTMRGAPLDRARTAALEFVRLLDPRDRVAVVTFAASVETPVVFTDTRAEAEIQLQEIAIDENALTTVLYDAMHRSIEMIRLGTDLPRRTFVVVFSDGQDSGSRHTYEQVAEIGRSKPNQTPVPVYAVGYSRFGGEGLPILERMSKDTTGEYVRASTPEEIESFFRVTRRQMRQSLVISYPGDLDGEEHEVDLNLADMTATRAAKYRRIQPNLVPYIAAGGVGVVVVAIALLIGRGRAKGRLVFTNGPLAGQSFARKGGRTRIGALADNDIVIESELISRFHASITGSVRNAKVTDEGSSNGTFVNDTQITTSPVRKGDRIRFADVEAVFEA